MLLTSKAGGFPNTDYVAVSTLPVTPPPGTPVSFYGNTVVVDPNATAENDLEDQITKAVLWNFDEGTKAKKPHSVKLNRLWKRYNNNYDQDQKDKWMSKRNFPKVKMAVERLTAVISRILTLAREDWFQLYSYNTALRPYYSLFKEMLEELLSNDKLNFFDVFQKTVKSGLMANLMCVLCTWGTDGVQNPEEPEASVPEDELLGLLASMPTPELEPPTQLQMIVQNPRNVILDPTGRKRYVQLTRAYTRGEFRTEADARGFQYTDEAVASPAVPDPERMFEDTIYNSVDMSEIQKQDNIFLIEHIGDLYDQHGFLLAKNAHIIIANKKFLVYRDKLRFAHGNNPVIYCGLIDNPFSVYFENHISVALDSFETWVEFMNMSIDYYQTRILPIYEVNTNILEYDEDVLTKGLYPGRVIRKTSSEPAVNSVQLTDVPPTFWQFLDYFWKGVQEDSGLIDAMAGLPQTRNKQTAQEFTRRLAEAGALFDYAFRNIETSFLVPILRQAFVNMLQFTASDVWKSWIQNKIAGMIEEEITKINPNAQQLEKQVIEIKFREKNPHIALYESLLNMSPEERVQKFGKTIMFKTEVFSAVFDRQAMLEKLTFMMGQVSRIPMAAATFKWRKFLGNMVRTMGFDEDEYLRTEEEAFKILKTMGQQFGMDEYVASEEAPTEVGPPNQLGGIAQAANEGQLGADNIPTDYSELVPGTVRSGNPQNRGAMAGIFG